MRSVMGTLRTCRNPASTSLRQHVLEEFQVLVENRLRFVEDHQHEAGFADEGVGFHLTQVVDDVLAPLRP